MTARHRIPINAGASDREAKIEKVLGQRQPTLTVVLENIHDIHNVNAILRSCDAAGVDKVHLVYYIESFPEQWATDGVGIGKASVGAHKWLDFEMHDSIESCFKKLHEDGFRILATKIDSTAKKLYDNDLTQPTAFVLGNEHRGISDEAARLADELIYIPMMGMAESLNVSVATAVCLFEALRQRSEAGMYKSPQLSPDALRSKKLEWMLR
jgi:tRNA (guanosine-2'-O-)-methyltransferase